MYPNYRVSLKTSKSLFIVNAIIAVNLITVFLLADINIAIKVLLCFCVLVALERHVNEHALLKSKDAVTSFEYVNAEYVFHYVNLRNHRVKRVKIIYICPILIVIGYKHHNKQKLLIICADKLSIDDFRLLKLHCTVAAAP